MHHQPEEIDAFAPYVLFEISQRLSIPILQALRFSLVPRVSPLPPLSTTNEAEKRDPGNEVGTC